VKIGILGGTFNPVHKGHLHLARCALKTLKLNKVVFVPAYIPPHKSWRHEACAVDRLKMVRLAIAGNSKFIVSDYEVRAKSKSYTIKTLRHFRRKFGSKHELFFLTGADSVSELTTWKEIDKIFKLAVFVVAARPGFSGKGILEAAIYLNIRPCNISSTRIRQRIKKGLGIKGLVPAKVGRYIEKRRLYAK